MAKPPRQRHSKSRAKPVTIDLAPEPDTTGDGIAEPVAFEAPSPADTTAPATGVAPDETTVAEEAAPDGGGAAETPEPLETTAPPLSTAATGRTGSALTGGLIGGLLALLVAAGGQWLGLIPSLGVSDEPAVSQDDFAALSSKVEQIAAQPVDTGLDDTVSRLRTDLDALAQRADELEAGMAEQPATAAQDSEALATLQQRLDQVESTVAGLSGAAPSADGSTAAAAVDIAPLQTRIALLADDLQALSQRLDTAAGTAQTANEGVATLDASVAELGTRIDTLDASVSQLSARPDSALPVAAAALKSAMDRGGSFTQELETYAGVTGDTETVAALREFAGAGVPTNADLVASFSATANAMLDAVNKPAEDAGLLDRLTNSARGLVRIRPVGEVEGEGPEAVIARIEARLQAGDLAAALSEFGTLPEPAQQAGSAWAEKLKSRMTADALVEDKLNAVLTGAGN